MTSAVAKLISSIVGSIPFPLNLVAIGGGVATLYGAYEGAKALFFADGGRVSGPGGPREDRVPAYLSNGEHVLTAREVAAMGGHGAVERFRFLAVAGRLPAFASGGALARPPMPRAYPTHTAPGPSLDLGPVVDRLDSLARRIDAQTLRLDASNAEQGSRISATLADPDGARRLAKLGRDRARAISPRRGSRL
jgi:hypothetical protein